MSRLKHPNLSNNALINVLYEKLGLSINRKSMSSNISKSSYLRNVVFGNPWVTSRTIDMPDCIIIWNELEDLENERW
jgi:hypothetical protein